MDSGYYAACTALTSRTQALDTIANNLANASTIGYRAQHNIFSSVLAVAENKPGSSLNQAINNYGIMSGTTLDYSQGALQKTGNDLDVAIQGTGFFVVQTKNGPVYTRNGAFRSRAKGSWLRPTAIPSLATREPSRSCPGQVSISPDGTISSNGAVAGKLKLVEFPAGTQLTSAGRHLLLRAGQERDAVDRFDACSRERWKAQM